MCKMTRVFFVNPPENMTPPESDYKPRKPGRRFGLFRLVGRLLENLRHAQAWNPFRWPLLASQVKRMLRTRGLKGTLLRAQQDRSLHVPGPVSERIAVRFDDPEPPGSIPTGEPPRVSLIIPVHGNWSFTAACLRSLASTPCRERFEVIVVDDCSGDETATRLREVDGIRVLRNAENLGFVASCNRGAGAARGEFLVLLNNDTHVLEGWLEALVETFERFPDTGLAGARLIYPDGRLQESGGIVFSDGSGWNYGKFDDAERPDYRFAREADYCSGACIAIPRALFTELGGFDERFSPAFYEDTDLAFRVRERGLKVRVQPAATVVHHEGATTGRDPARGVKRHQEINRERFVERWQEALASQPAPIVDPSSRAEARRARDHRLKGRVLLIDAYTPEPDQDSGSLRLIYLMQCFRDLGYGVTFMPNTLEYSGEYTRNLEGLGIEMVHAPWSRSPGRFFAERGSEFRFVMVSRHYIASRYIGLVRKHCPGARFLFDTVDLHYLREERMAEHLNSAVLRQAAAQTRRSELALVDRADATLVVSPVEKTVLEKAAPGAKVHVISNVHEVSGSRRDWSARKDLFFVGSYQHPPNIDAAEWFVQSIWPLIRERLPAVQFHLIGSKAPDSVRALEGNGVCFQGFQKDLDPWLDGCRLAVAPLRFGAGIKGKVNLSMSRGQPVVATPVAVEGMFAEPGRDILVSDTEAGFADAVVRLYQDEDTWNRVSIHGMENVNRYFSVENARLGLQELLTSLRPGTRP